MDEQAVARAEALLGCRHGITQGEVVSAYRRAVVRARPDLGAVDGDWMTQVQAARDLLLSCAPPDRRRRPRREQGPAATYRLLRRSVWGMAPSEDERIDLRL